jgi:hypothetical protein
MDIEDQAGVFLKRDVAEISRLTGMILNLNTKQLFNVYEYDSMVDPDHVKEVM